MKIKNIYIRGFGKFHRKQIECSDGINLICGENGGGKTTLHTFLCCMLFGIRRKRGRAAATDTYSRYEPWEFDGNYGGALDIESGGKIFRLERSFLKDRGNTRLVCETDGELLSIEDGDLDMLLGGVSETVFENTVFVGQLKIRTEEGLVRELQNYIANYQGSGDGSLDVGKALEILRARRKEMEAAQREEQNVRAEQGKKLTSRMQFLEEENRRLADELEEVRGKLKQEMFHKKVPYEQVRRAKQRVHRDFKWAAACAGGMILLAALTVMLFYKIPSVIIRIGLSAACVCMAAAMIHFIRRGRGEIREKEEDSSQEEYIRMLKWQAEHLERDMTQKTQELENIQNAYREFCDSGGDDESSRKLQAVSLAMERIQQLSAGMQKELGKYLQKKVSDIFCEITGGKYTQVLVDEDFSLSLYQDGRCIPLAQESTGTVEQLYFAFRMAAEELLCREETLPVFLDDAFAMYDAKRLRQALIWLEKSGRQVFIFTCQDREEKILDELGISYRKTEMTKEKLC